MCKFVNFTFTFVSLLLVFAIDSVDSTAYNYSDVLTNEEVVHYLRLLGSMDWLLSSRNAPVDVYDATESNSTCTDDIETVRQAIMGQQEWALKMLDAASKIPAGLLEGNIIDPGMYNECLDIREKLEDREIRGRHCMYSVQLTFQNVTFPIVPTLSICVPSTCQSPDVMDFFNTTIGSINQLKDVVKVISVNCSPDDADIWDTEFTVCIVILGVFVGLLTICSIYVAIYERINSESHKNEMISILGRFSFQKNIYAILSMEEKKGNLPVIHGIRSLSIAWVVLGHAFMSQFVSMNVNTVHMLEMIRSWNILYIATAPFSVDTFFVLSGFLMTYTFLKQMKKQKNFNVPMYYIHRYFRLTPSVIALLVIAIVFVPKMISGPRFEIMKPVFTGDCRANWWHHVLYVQNFVNTDDNCLGHLWYLAVDMQLFLISPLILYPLHKKPKLGLVILTGFIAASLITPATIIGYNEYRTVSYLSGDSNLENVRTHMTDVYKTPYCRAGPWLVGILLGYIVLNFNRKLNKSTVFIGWLLTVAALCFCTFGTRYFIRPDYEYDAALETFFATVERPVWGLAIAWIIFASIFNYAGPVSSFLSWKLFLPISRLSYCIYLVHMVIQYVQIANKTVPEYYTEYATWRYALSDFIISFIVAFFFCLLFESTTLALEKLLFQERKKESHHESQKELRPASQDDINNIKE